MHIVIDARLAGVSQRGIGRYSEEMLLALDHEAAAKTITAFVNEPSRGALKQKIKHIRLIGVRGRWYSFWAEQIRFSFQVLMSRPSLVCFFHWNVPLPLACIFWLLEIPWIVTIHDLMLLDRGPQRAATTRAYPFYWLKFQVFRVLVGVVIRLSSEIVAVSEATKQDVIGLFPKAAGRIFVIGEGSEHIERLLPNARASLEVLDRIRTPLSYVLYVGSTYPHKNLQVVVDAFARATETLGDVPVPLSLVIVGSPDRFQARLSQWIQEHFPKSRVFFVVATSDEQLALWYLHARAVVLPSTHEGFGLPMVEAFAAGTPVIASDIPALKEIASDAARYFPCNDPAALARVLERIYADTPEAQKEHREFVIRGHKRAAAFQWSNAASLFLDQIAERTGAAPVNPVWVRTSQMMLWTIVAVSSLFTVVFLPSRTLDFLFVLSLAVAVVLARHSGRVFERWVLVSVGALLTVFLGSAAMTFLSIAPVVVFSLELPSLLLLSELAAAPPLQGRSLPRWRRWLFVLFIWEFSISVSWLALPLLSKAVLVLLAIALAFGFVMFPRRLWRSGSIVVAVSAAALLISGYFFR